jgi:hypothetical protein
MQEHSWKRSQADPALLVHAAHALTTPRNAHANAQLQSHSDRALGFFSFSFSLTLIPHEPDSPGLAPPLRIDPTVVLL